MKIKKRKIYFVTGNKEKIMVMRAALEEFKELPFLMIPRKVDCKEKQSDDIEEIASSSAFYASRLLKADVVKVDSGLLIDALNDFPGPYSAFVERHLTIQQFLRLLENEHNRDARYQQSLAYCCYEGKPVVFTDFTLGRISERPSGRYGWGFDQIFIAEDDKKTMANYSDEQRIRRYSFEIWRKLVYFICDFNG